MRVSNALIALSLVVVIAEAAIHSLLLRDVIRGALLFELLVVWLTTVLIGRRYFTNYRQEPGKARLLPSHVARLAGGTAGCMIGIAASVIALIGKPFVWYTTPLFFPFVTILVLGLIDMLMWLPYRNVSPGAKDVTDFRRAVHDAVHPRQHHQHRRYDDE